MAIEREASRGEAYSGEINHAVNECSSKLPLVGVNLIIKINAIKFITSGTCHHYFHGNIMGDKLLVNFVQNLSVNL